jgi:hypothetical protein
VKKEGEEKTYRNLIVTPPLIFVAPPGRMWYDAFNPIAKVIVQLEKRYLLRHLNITETSHLLAFALQTPTYFLPCLSRSPYLF